MKCLHCKHLDLQSNVKKAKLGFGLCAVKKESGESVSFRFDRNCDRYRDVDDEIKEKRITWADGILKAREMQK